MSSKPEPKLIGYLPCFFEGTGQLTDENILQNKRTDDGKPLVVTLF